jgi:hypothetical protein
MLFALFAGKTSSPSALGGQGCPRSDECRQAAVVPTMIYEQLTINQFFSKTNREVLSRGGQL